MLIIGLGNPGDKYAMTRHNAGFMILDALAEKLEEGFTPTPDMHADVIETNVDGAKVILAKPATFMNNSGEAVAALAHRYNIPTCDIWVVYDEVALPFGVLRVRLEGSAGGHNGVKNVIEHLKAEDFVRFRFGVDEQPAEMDLANWVLSRFKPEEQKALPDMVSRVADKLLEAINAGTVEGVTENLE